MTKFNHNGHFFSARTFSFFFVALFVAATANGATLYKWVDENGNVYYQDQPPPAGVNFEQQPLPTSGDDVSVSTDADVQVPDGADPLVLYTVPSCDACDLVRVYLNRYSLPFEEKDAESNFEIQKELQAVSGGYEVPTLMIGERSLSGFNREALLKGLITGGYAPMLNLDEIEEQGDTNTASNQDTDTITVESPFSAEE